MLLALAMLLTLFMTMTHTVKPLEKFFGESEESKDKYLQGTAFSNLAFCFFLRSDLLCVGTLEPFGTGF